MLTLTARGLAVAGAGISLWVAAVFVTFLLPALERPDLFDGGGGLLSVAEGAGAFGLPALWLLALAVAGALGALVAPLRGWIAVIVLILPSLVTPVFAAAGVGLVYLWHPDDVAPMAAIGAATLFPGGVLLLAGVVAFVHGRLKRAAARRAAREAAAGRPSAREAAPAPR